MKSRDLAESGLFAMFPCRRKRLTAGVFPQLRTEQGPGSGCPGTCRATYQQSNLGKLGAPPASQATQSCRLVKQNVPVRTHRSREPTVGNAVSVRWEKGLNGTSVTVAMETHLQPLKQYI